MERREERSASPLSDFRSVCPQAGAARRPFDITKTSPPFLCLSSLGRLSQRERRADRFASTYYYGLLTRRALTPKVALTRLHVLPRIDATILSSPLPVRSILRPFFFFLLGATPRGRLAVMRRTSPLRRFLPSFLSRSNHGVQPFRLAAHPSRGRARDLSPWAADILGSLLVLSPCNSV